MTAHLEMLLFLGTSFLKSQYPNYDIDREAMKQIPYASGVGSLRYTQVYTRSDIALTVVFLEGSNQIQGWIICKLLKSYEIPPTN